MKRERENEIVRRERMTNDVLLGTTLVQKSQKSFQLLEQLRSHVHSRKSKKVEILALSQEVTYYILPSMTSSLLFSSSDL